MGFYLTLGVALIGGILYTVVAMGRFGGKF